MQQVQEHKVIMDREIAVSRVGVKVLQSGFELIPLENALIWSKLQGFEWSEEAHEHLLSRLGWTTANGIMLTLNDNECAVLRKGLWKLLKRSQDGEDNRYPVRDISSVYGLLADEDIELEDAKAVFTKVETVQEVAAAMLENAPVTDNNKRVALDAAARMCRRLSQVQDPKHLGDDEKAMILRVQAYLTELKAA